MKKYGSLCFCLFSLAAYSQNVGIGTTSPRARLHVADSNVIFSAQGDVSGAPGNPPLSGGGRRMMWYPDKAAFRSGFVSNTQWNKDNVGMYSTAFGYNAIASGESSFAAGNESKVFGEKSIGLGYFSNALGPFSTAVGYGTMANGLGSAALGSEASASGLYAVALGYSSASGEYSVSMGYASSAAGINSTAGGFTGVANGAFSTAFGHHPQANGSYSIAIGESVTANSWISTALGRHNDPIVANATTSWVLTEPLLIVGNGTGAADKKNAMVILKNGNVGIGINAPNAPLAFPPALGKKITLYPGATGDVGMAVQGNQLLIYSDNPNASVKLGYDQAGAFTNNFEVFGNGNALLRGSLTQNSDARLKRDVQAIQNATTALQKINGYHYFWKEAQRDQSLQTGLLAQEVQQVFPHLVKQDANGILSVNYTGFIPQLIESAKEQQKEINDLRTRLEKLEKLLAEK